MVTLERTTTSQDLARILRERILAGALSAGAKLDENRLAADLGVSRTPLREALARLEQDGLITHEPYRGRVVTASDDDVVAETFPILGALEALAVRTTAGISKQTLDRLDALNARIARRGTTPARRFTLDREWHRQLVAACGNARLIETTERLRAVATRYDGGPERGMADVAGSTEDHAGVVAALRAGDTARGAHLIEVHWANGIEVVRSWKRS